MNPFTDLIYILLRVDRSSTGAVEEVWVALGSLDLRCNFLFYFAKACKIMLAPAESLSSRRMAVLPARRPPPMYWLGLRGRDGRDGDLLAVRPWFLAGLTPLIFCIYCHPSRICPTGFSSIAQYCHHHWWFVDSAQSRRPTRFQPIYVGTSPLYLAGVSIPGDYQLLWATSFFVQSFLRHVVM